MNANEGPGGLDVTKSVTNIIERAAALGPRHRADAPVDHVASIVKLAALVEPARHRAEAEAERSLVAEYTAISAAFELSRNATIERAIWGWPVQ